MIKVWFLSHPIAPDDENTIQMNMASILRKLKILNNLGVITHAPYVGNLLAGVEDTASTRERGLEATCHVLAGYDGMILWGHKLTRGMRQEYNAFMGPVVNLVGISEEEVKDANLMRLSEWFS